MAPSYGRLAGVLLYSVRRWSRYAGRATGVKVEAAGEDAARSSVERRFMGRRACQEEEPFPRDLQWFWLRSSSQQGIVGRSLVGGEIRADGGGRAARWLSTEARVDKVEVSPENSVSETSAGCESREAEGVAQLQFRDDAARVENEGGKAQAMDTTSVQGSSIDEARDDSYQSRGLTNNGESGATRQAGARERTKEVGKKGVNEEKRGEKKKPKKTREKEESKQYVIHPMDAPSLWAEMDNRIQSRRHHFINAREKDRLLEIFRNFRERGWAADQALALYINSKFFPTAAARFRKFFFRSVTPELAESLLAFRNIPPAEEYLFPLFAEFCFNEFPAEIKAYKELVTSADMTKPHTWYPFARAMKRKIIYHRGPTNSGKTYNALQRFRQARSGIYCGPLRLLAMEVYDTMNLDGVYCNLVTGQEKKIMPFAEHTACTIEMANLMSSYEVAVIDEIQMITDEYRGWAWTRALLGVQADEVHVCGDSSALPLLQTLCASTGDDFVDFEYERFKPLKVDPRSLEGNFRNVQPGDCIVAFSRREIFEIKRQVETLSPHRCCVVYGALPPETRRQQAKLFNEPSSGYEVLVASDAVGMGLNLNIRRVVFYALQKFNGEQKALIPAPMVKQIAGRAGRRGSLFPEGIATSFYSQDIPHLLNGLQQPVEPLTAAGLFPFFEQVELFASQLPDITFAQLLDRFVETSRVDGAYFLCKTDSLRRVANMLEKVPGLSLEDRFRFCFAPANSRDPEAMAALLRFATVYAARDPVQLSMASPTGPAADDLGLMNLETKHQVASMYLWLSQHFPDEAFPQGAVAELLTSEIALLLQASLARPSKRSRLRPPGEAAPRFKRRPREAAEFAYRDTHSFPDEGDSFVEKSSFQDGDVRGFKFRGGSVGGEVRRGREREGSRVGRERQLNGGDVGSSKAELEREEDSKPEFASL